MNAMNDAEVLLYLELDVYVLDLCVLEVGITLHFVVSKDNSKSIWLINFNSLDSLTDQYSLKNDFISSTSCSANRYIVCAFSDSMCDIQCTQTCTLPGSTGTSKTQSWQRSDAKWTA